MASLISAAIKSIKSISPTQLESSHDSHRHGRIKTAVEDRYCGIERGGLCTLDRQLRNPIK